MELQEIFNIVKDISWPAAIAVLGVLILKSPLTSAFASYINSKIPGNSMTPKHEEDLSQIKSDVRLVRMNHLHEVIDILKDIAAGQERMQSSIDRAVENSSRNFTDLKESLSYLKAKMNGHS